MRILLLNPRNGNSSFGLITTIVKIKAARVRNKAFIDSPGIELLGISKSVVTKPMFLQKKIIIGTVVKFRHYESIGRLSR